MGREGKFVLREIKKVKGKVSGRLSVTVQDRYTLARSQSPPPYTLPSLIITSAPPTWPNSQPSPPAAKLPDVKKRG
ncbi:hypothetical protein E2C01_090141 [Portunus trituberculatus]|uniref:Uncharacterized protein n=1 Tax=Portunus trituberculatus TaxID=210409 RepID=A0A5B7JJG0_PORTR|nr:hypothetical protein [Portunus trituberculatus]